MCQTVTPFWLLPLLAWSARIAQESIDPLDTYVAGGKDFNYKPVEQVGLQKLADCVVAAASEVEREFEQTSVVLYHALSPLNFITSFVFHGVVAEQPLAAPAPQSCSSGSIGLTLRTYEGSDRLPTVGQAPGLEVTGWILHDGAWGWISNLNDTHVTAMFLDEDDPMPEKLAALASDPAVPRVWKDRARGSAPRKTLEIPRVPGLDKQSMAAVAQGRVAEGTLPAHVTADSFYDELIDLKLPDCEFDHLPAVRNRFLSTNINMFGSSKGAGGESSWWILFDKQFSEWSAFGLSGPSPFLSQIFETQAVPQDVRDVVSAQLDLIGRVYTGSETAVAAGPEGCPSCPRLGEELSQLFPGLGDELHRSAVAWASRPRSAQSAVLLQVVLPQKLAEDAVYISVPFGWRGEPLPAKPSSTLTDEEWAQEYLKTWMVDFEPSRAREFFSSETTYGRLRFLKNSPEGDELQGRVLLTRKASGYEDGGPQFFAYGSMFDGQTLMEDQTLMRVITAMAEVVRGKLI